MFFFVFILICVICIIKANDPSPPKLNILDSAYNSICCYYWKHFWMNHGSVDFLSLYLFKFILTFQNAIDRSQWYNKNRNCKHLNNLKCLPKIRNFMTLKKMKLDGILIWLSKMKIIFSGMKICCWALIIARFALIILSNNALVFHFNPGCG